LNNKQKLFATYTELVKLKDSVSRLVSLRLTLCHLGGLFLFDFAESEFHFKAAAMDKSRYENEAAMFFVVREVLESEFERGGVSYENDEITCRLGDEGIAFKISFYASSQARERFVRLRQVIFENEFMLPLFHTILHFVRQDVKFVDKADFNAEWYLHYFVAFCIRTGFIQEPWMTGYDVENDDGLNEWFNIFDALLRALKEPVSVAGRILLQFYRENAFQTEQELAQVRREHFFNVFTMISNATEIGAVWDVVIGGDDNDDEDDEKQMTEYDEESKRGSKSGRPSLNFIEKSCRSPCLYAKDAYLMLVADSTPFEANFVKFDLFTGKKFVKHSKKECYVPRPVRNNKNDADLFLR